MPSGRRFGDVTVNVQNDPEALLSARDIAELAGKSYKWGQRLMASGELPTVTLSARGRRVRRADWTNWCTRQGVGRSSDAAPRR